MMKKEKMCLLGLVPALTVPMTLPCLAGNNAELPPNIIVVLTDDMGYGDIGIYGGKFIPTPNIDRMAEEGSRFNQYYSASPISSPSRCGLLTGMYPGKWHITTYLQGKAGNKAAEMADYLDPSAPTLPKVMKNAGYKTGHFGKWHLGGGRDVRNAPPFVAYGYDEYCSTYESPQPDSLLTATDWIWSPQDSVKRWNRTAYFVDKTLAFLERHRGEACFVNLWPDDMHTPWVGNFEQQQVFPDGQESEKNFRVVLAEYDRQIGRLLREIKNMNLENNTIVIFTSDNGPAPSFKGSRAGNMRGCKASLFEGGIHMPFIIWDTKGEIPSGKTDDTTVVSALDLYKSLSSLAGIKLPADCKSDGMDMSAALKGVPQERREPLFWEYRRNESKAFPRPADKDVSPAIAVRYGKWKLLVDKDSTNVLLYDLEDNLRENVDLSKKHPQVASRLSKLALEWWNSLPEF